MANTPRSYTGISQIKDPIISDTIRRIWDLLYTLRDTVKGPIECTLSPDTKPRNLTPQDSGYLLYATDYDRVYKWSGTAWEDAPGQPTRYSISFFQPTIDPGIGWAKCNGATVSASTSDARVEFKTIPIIAALNFQIAWMRI